MQQARKQQMAATDVLAALLQAADTRREARDLIDSLSEEFFHISSTYLEMVRTLRRILASLPEVSTSSEYL